MPVTLPTGPATAAPPAGSENGRASGHGKEAQSAAAPLRLAVRRNRPRRWGRFALLLLGLGIVIAIVYAMLPDPVPAEFTVVSRGPMEATVEEDGRTRVRDRYEILAPAAGTLMRVGLEPGDPVAAGEIVARLAPLSPAPLDARSRAEAGARVDAAAAALRQAQSALTRGEDAAALAAREAERVRELFTAGASTQQALDRAELAARTAAEDAIAAGAGVTAANAELAGRRATLTSLLDERRGSSQPELALRAPASGVVLSVRRESEGPVAPGQPLLAIGDPGALEVEVDLLTADAALVRPGAPVRLDHWGGATPLKGRVLRVEPAAFTRLSALGVEEQRVNVVVEIAERSDRWSSLGDGFRVEASVVVWSAPDAVQVPVNAIFRDGDGWSAFRVDDGRARLVPIRIGRRTDAVAEILSGLAPGDSVVAYPGELVRDGVRVRER